jgi:hypothetical protein
MTTKGRLCRRPKIMSYLVVIVTLAQAKVSEDPQVAGPCEE